MLSERAIIMHAPSTRPSDLYVAINFQNANTQLTPHGYYLILFFLFTRCESKSTNHRRVNVFRPRGTRGAFTKGKKQLRTHYLVRLSYSWLRGRDRVLNTYYVLLTMILSNYISHLKLAILLLLLLRQNVNVTVSVVHHTSGLINSDEKIY